MVLELALDRIAARVAVSIILAAGCIALTLLILSNFILGVITDPRADVTRDQLRAAAAVFPSSANLNARLAESEMADLDGSLERAESYALRAANLAPYNYSPRLDLASIQEALGRSAASEATLKAALELAPANAEVNWRLANLLLREGKTQESLGGFRIAFGANPSLMPATFEMILRASSDGRASGRLPVLGDSRAGADGIAALESLTAGRNSDRLALASFLLKQGRVEDAARVFSGLDRGWIRASADAPAFLKSMMAAQHAELARRIWAGIISEPAAAGRVSEREPFDVNSQRAPAGPTSEPALPASLPVVWNGSFESSTAPGLDLFDWSIKQSDFARISIDRQVAHSGSRSLRIDFAGRDTTSLKGEAEQAIVVVGPGKQYRLEFYAKTEGLVTTEGPRVVVADGSTWLAASAPIAGGTKDWQRVTVEFAAPAGRGGEPVLSIGVFRKPRFSYDDPMKGTIWLDDFSVVEVGSSGREAK